jgi:hypothetical protein
MAQLSKQALIVENNTSFPNNTTNYITPAILRSFNVDMIDSLVDENTYNVDSGSWNRSISSLNQFTASASGLTTGSLLITASAAGNVITFTKGNNTTFNVTVATGSIPDISNLNQATASLQAYTASANVKFSNLESTTASLNTSVSNINTFTASAAISITNLNSVSASQQTSINNLNAKTGSYATTGSNTFTSANTFTSISASSFVSASIFVGDGSKLTGITSSISMPILDEGIPQGNAVSLNFTGSAITATVAGGVAIISVQGLDTGSFNAYTASTNSSISQLNAATASLQTNSASVNTSISALNTNSASVNTSISALNTYTASQSTASLVTSITNLNTFSASALVSISNINSTTASLNTSVTNLNSATASLFTSASLALVTASFDTGTRNLTFTKGNTTQFSVNIPDVSGSAGTFVTTSSFNAYTQSNDQRVSSLETNSASVNISISNLNAATSSYIKSSQTSSMSVATASIALAVSTSISTQNLQHFVTFVDNSTGTQAIYVDGGIKYNPNQDLLLVNNITSSGYISASAIVINGVPVATSAITASSLVTASFNNDTRNLTFTKGDTTTFSVNIPDVSGSTGNFATTGSNSFNGNQILSGSLFQSSSNSITTPDGNNVGTYIKNRVEIYGGNGTTGPTPRLFIGATDGRKQTLGGTFQNIDATATTGLGASYQAYADTGSAANLNLAVFDANNGNGDTEILINTDITGTQFKDWDRNIGDYSNWMTLGPNDGVTIPLPQFTRGLSITGSAPSILSQSFSGSLITNLTDTYSDVARVNQIVTLTSASYASLASGSLTNPNTLYVVSGSTQVNPAFPYTGSAQISGSLTLTGSAHGNVVALSISSNTASMDLNSGNYFTLTLADTTTTHITATNITPGTTATLVITTGTNSSASLAPILLQPSGSSYSATNGSAKKDVLSIVSVGTSNAYVVSTLNMV